MTHWIFYITLIYLARGSRCLTDVDECLLNPEICGNGICRNEEGSYKCYCTPGFIGRHCDTEIDECFSQPCRNGGTCQKKLDSYECVCAQGYLGTNCEVDLNKCASNPCSSGSTCVSLINNFACSCAAGMAGRLCDININECESNPCSKHGNCIDGIGNYTCVCEPGFEGAFCELDIDECERYQPCGSHGTCVDRTNHYHCDCEENFGGKNCSVPLSGCKLDPCLNGGTCKPFLANETEQRFNCSCKQGFRGDSCEKTTTISMAVGSSISVKTQRVSGYDLNLKFKTTQPNGILAFGASDDDNYFLEMVDGRLNLHSSLLNKWEGIYIGSGLNDSAWHHVSLSINATHLVFTANDEQTIYPVIAYSTANDNRPSFPTTHIGGKISTAFLRLLINYPHRFVGCLQDVAVNGKTIFPEAQDATDDIILTNIESGCPRIAQCSPNPCHSNGECTDLWNTFSCKCQRPYFGQMCEHSISAPTFGHENTTNSVVVVEPNATARHAVSTALDISMFIRTKQSTGQVFYLGSDPRKTSRANKDSYVSAELHGGELVVKMQFNGNSEAYTVAGIKLDDGYKHLISVVRNSTVVEIKLNKTEHFRRTVSATALLDAQVLYIGGPPPMAAAFPAVAPRMLADGKNYFKGIIQDVKIGNGAKTMIVELYPLNTDDSTLPPAFGQVTIDRTSVLEGEVSDDLCRKNPCRNNAECQNTWNDYICTCSNGYKGKNCQNIENYCQLVTCTGESVCPNLELCLSINSFTETKSIINTL